MREPRGHNGPRQVPIDQIDRNTGQVLSEGALVWMPSRTQHPYGDRWIAMTMDGLDKLTATPGIGMREMRIFAVLLKRLDYENFIMVPQTDIVEATGFAASNVSASIKKLLPLARLFQGLRLADPRPTACLRKSAGVVAKSSPRRAQRDRGR